jgi:Tfp pilus assembly protein PilW
MELFVGFVLSIALLVGTLSPFMSKYSANRPANGEAKHLDKYKKQVSLIEKKHKL